MLNHDLITQSVTTQVASHLKTKDFSLKLLAGDGSTRQFFRLTASNPPKTLVLLFDPGWILSRDYAPHQAFLKANRIPVPDFLLVNEKEGIL